MLSQKVSRICLYLGHIYLFLWIRDSEPSSCFFFFNNNILNDFIHSYQNLLIPNYLCNQSGFLTCCKVCTYITLPLILIGKSFREVTAQQVSFLKKWVTSLIRGTHRHSKNIMCITFQHNIGVSLEIQN